MKARSRTLALAAALAALLAALIAGALLGVERPDADARARHDRETLAFPVRPSEVVRLSIAPRGAPEVRLLRSGEEWSLSPPGGEASAAAVEGLLERLSGMRVRSTLPADPGALAARGLDPPAVRLTVTLQDGSAMTLDLGDESSFDRTRFARRGGEILAVEGVPPAVLDRDPARLLSAPGGG